MIITLNSDFMLIYIKLKPNELVSESLANTFSEIGTKNATLSLVYQIFSKKELERRGFIFI